MIDDKFVELVKECLSFTEQFLTKPENLQFALADYSTGQFEHVNVPSFTSADGHMVVFNRDWLKRSLPDHVDDVRFFIYHELRHVHQKFQISKLKTGLKADEDIDIIKLWSLEFSDYKTNYGDIESQNRNFSQSIEQDANAYALALLNMKYLGTSNWSFEHSLPEEAYAVADRKSQEYYKNRPELKRYYDKRYREITGQRICGKRPERNEQCPCGTGHKFKRCCIGKGIYD